METATLSPDQRQQAEKLLDALREERATTPTDIVDGWLALPLLHDLDAAAEKDVYDEPEETRRWVSPSTVEGTIRNNADRFRAGSIETALTRLLDGRFELDHDYPPEYLEVAGHIYVCGDGNHRTMTCKALGVGPLYAEVTTVPVSEAVFDEALAHPYDPDPMEHIRGSQTGISAVVLPDFPPVDGQDSRSLLDRLRAWIRR